jgi:16S rRNA (cytosine1402-N4)-methyltransferase
MTELTHLPIMEVEVTDQLVLNEHGKFLDCTFGRGGHSTAILKKLSTDGKLTALDKDKDAITHSAMINDKRFNSIHTSIIDYAKTLKKKVLMEYLWT